MVLVKRMKDVAFCTRYPLRFTSPIVRTDIQRRPICTCNVQSHPTTAITWNVNSIRSLQRKNPQALQNLVSETSASILCLQETKLQKSHEPLFSDLLSGWNTTMFNSSTARLGYSGTATWAKGDSRTSILDIPNTDGNDEGRLVSLEFPGVWLINVYTMNSGTELKRLENRLVWDSAFRKLIRRVRRLGKPVIVMGDLNVARNDIDVHDPVGLRGRPGFSDEERESFDDLLETCGLVDAYRMLYPDDTEKYTFWDYRTKARAGNRGWRIDYALVSEDMVDAVRDVRILDHVHGSDHCPVAIELEPGLF